ncbi:MAG: hypothetical protein JO048_16360 [Methylobacteriaceae bacterium]|nr:hypothetical protein [Methylobacteriaceae bacterium]
MTGPVRAILDASSGEVAGFDALIRAWDGDDAAGPVPPLWWRLPPLYAAEIDRAVARAVSAGADHVVLPSLARAPDLQHLGAKLAVAEAEAERDDGAVGIVATLTHATGLLALARAPEVSRRLRALVDVMPERSRGLAQAQRGLVGLVAEALAVPAYLALPDMPASGAVVRRAVRDGYAGLLTRRPADLAAIRSAFS